MATQPLDASREARATLRTVVQDHGTAALSNPQLMNSLLQDLMPGSPRESRVLVAAADADVAGILMERAKQHVSMAAAVLQAATALEERTALAPDACQWAARQMAEALNLPSETTPNPVRVPDPVPAPGPVRVPDPAPGPVRSPKPPPGQARKPVSAAIVAAWAALVCALSVPLQLLAPFQFNAGYSWLLALSGLALFSAAMLTFRSQSRYVGTGMIFGAALATVPYFVEASFIPGIGGGFVAASVLTTLAALVAAGSSVVYFARAFRQGRANLAHPLVAAFCAAAIGYTLASIPGDSQSFTGGRWITIAGLLGPGVHGRYVFAGLVALVALAIPALTVGFLASGTGARVGVVTGWLAVNGAGQVYITLFKEQPGIRASSGFYFSWVFWVIALALGIAMLVGDRGLRVSGVQTPVP
jgi:hypothetical protein